MQDYNDRRPQSCATFLAAKIEGFYKGWNCSSLIRPNIFSESYSSAATLMSMFNEISKYEVYTAGGLCGVLYF